MIIASQIVLELSAIFHVLLDVYHMRERYGFPLCMDFISNLPKRLSLVRNIEM